MAANMYCKLCARYCLNPLKQANYPTTSFNPHNDSQGVSAINIITSFYMMKPRPRVVNKCSWVTQLLSD